MAWRFKASKYKNAAPIVPKPEACIRDICVGSYQTYGNNICASASFMAFNWEHVGSSMAVLPLDDCGRKSKTMPLLHAHSDTITDMHFSPFHDGLLLTGSQDSLVKVWHIPPEGLKESLSTPECTLSQKQRRVENVGFHPVADGLIHVASGHELALWDLTKQREAFVNRDHTEVIQSTSWKKDGKLVATSCKDKRVRVLDPRVESPVLSVANSHQNIKDSRLVWLGDGDRILTTGFDAARLRQVVIRDVRNLSQAQKTLELDCSTGVLMPLFDPDTNMLFLAGKGDTTILYMELTDREPYLIEGLRHSGEQTKGACLVPKRALRVMEGEVNRVLQLASSSVVPIMYQVPRKSYREYHADLYPDTAGAVTLVSAPMWLGGRDLPVPSISLHPDAAQAAQVHRGDLDEWLKRIAATPVPVAADKRAATRPPAEPKEAEPKAAERAAATPDRDDERIDFVNVKDLIKGMEKQKAEPKEHSRENGFAKRADDEAEDARREGPERGDSEAGEPLSRSNSLLNGMQAPKPLPRSSISEEGEAPKPRPRTTAGYKPRLGPKPFSASTGSEEFSFDRVFSVPAVPGVDRNGAGDGRGRSAASPGADTPDDGGKAVSPAAERKGEYANGGPEASADDGANGGRPDSPGAADRRRPSSPADAGKSIADRRRAYEARSASCAPDCDAPASPAPLRRRDSLKSRRSPDRDEKRASVPNVATKRTSTVFGKVSKFRHLKGTPGHKSTHVENIKNVSRQISGECNGFCANAVRCAVPVSAGGGGGRLAVVELPTGATPFASAPPPHPAGLHPPALLHPAALQDFAFDPFRAERLLVAGDDGAVREWLVPEGGLSASTSEPARTFAAHADKIHLLRFHPTASDVVATAAHDLSVKIWDLAADPPVAALALTGHGDQIFALEWARDGDRLATVSKDGHVRVFDPRASPEAAQRGRSVAGGRGARLVWALHDTHLVVTGFDKASERQVAVYAVRDLAAPVCTVGLDVSPAILLPHLDHDSGTLFLTGRGDSTVYCYELTPEPPYLAALSHHRCASLHQGICFLPKNALAVDKVEFARALRLTNGNVEPLSFTVPRIKSELFQDDLFPPTEVTWRSRQTGREWLQGRPAAAAYVSLQPPGMEPLSAHAAPPPPAQAQAGRERAAAPAARAPADVAAQIAKSLSAKLSVDLKLEQDAAEGVDEAEWEQ